MAHQPLRPRTIHHEPTLEQQRQTFARARRRALEWRLHDLFLPYASATEDVYGGKMNLPPERSDSETGCSLTHPFVEWLGNHALRDSLEDRRRRELWTALHRLAREREDLATVVVEHARTHARYSALATRWGVAPGTVSQAHAEGLDLLLGWLGDGA